MTNELLANRYRVLHTLGEGTMGMVWAVEDTTTGTQVALKVISQNYGTTAKSILQFKQEFRLMTQLRHPNCCAVYDYGLLPDGAPYFTMEIVEGNHANAGVPVDGEAFTRTLTQLLLALGYVHQLGFVHRDIKGENVRVRPDGVVKLMDYGLMDYARRTGGSINGTVAYLAPEVIARGSIDARADLYAVGVLAYELLTGRQPFESDRPMEVLRAHLHDAPTPPGAIAPGVDPAHERLVLKLLAKNPLERYQSASQVLEDLGVDVPAGIGGSLLVSPLMGREPELAELGRKLERLLAGEPAPATLLWGPSGIGKSRLIEEFRYAVQLEDVPCVLGAGFEHGSTPYEPFVAVLKSLLPAMRAHAPDELARHAPVLVRLLGELGVEGAPELDTPSKEKLRLQGAIADTLVALARKRSLVVMLEDWQWADDLSHELLDYLLRNCQGAPLLFLLTARGPLDGKLPTIERRAIAELDREGVRRMVLSMLGTSEVGEAFVDRVAALSKGTPFFVEKLLEHLVQNLTLVNERGRWNTDVDLSLSRLPNNLKGLLMWRITCLSEAAQAIAQAGAVAGRGFGLDLLAELTGLGEDALFAAVESLNQHQIFVPTGEGTYQFAQDQIQELIDANLDPAEKTRLHRAMVTALERRHQAVPLAERSLEAVTALAHHAIGGQLNEQTIAYALEAGMRSAALYANAQAESFLAAGLALVKQAEDPALARSALDYLRSLADVWRLTGKNEAAKEAYQEAVALAEALGERLLTGRMLTHLARCHQVLGAFPEALAIGERSLAICRENDDATGLARCQLQLARIHYFSGNVAVAVEQAELALAVARRAENKGQAGEALAMIGYFYVASDAGKVAEGIESLDRSVALLGELGDKIALNTSYNFLGTAQNMMGNFRDAWRSFTHNRALSFEIGAQDELIFALLNLAITAYELGHFAEMAAKATDARAIAERLNSRFPLGMAVTLLAVADAYLGRSGDVRERLYDALAIARELKHRYMESQVLLYQTEVLLYLGRLGEAKEAAEALAALIQETGDKEPESRLSVLLAEILARLGDLAGARAAIDRALRGANLAHAKGIQVRAQVVRGWLALQEGEPDTARRLAEGSLVLATRLGSRLQEARLRGLLGELALATDRAQAAAHFEQMEAIAQETGVPGQVAIARFGRAAAAADEAARQLAGEARALLAAAMAELGPESQTCFVSLAERARILRGDLQPIEGERRVPEAPAAPSHLGLGGELWKRL